MDFTRKLLGSYEMMELIGSGGFADVYRGEQMWLRTPVAVKVLRIYVNPRDNNAVRRSLNEAFIANSLRHPHIIPIIDCNIQNGIPFIVMPFLANGSLRSIHPSGVPLPLDKVLCYAGQIAETLSFVHSHNLIHLDVKPENMLMGDDGRIYLSDFGTVSFIQNTGATAPQERAGTFAYMAPERFNGDVQTAASDIYSFGVVVYMWLTGRLPFTGSGTEVAYKHLYSAPPTRPLYAMGIDRATQRVVLKALEKNPKKRYQSADEFYQALHNAKKMADQRRLPFALRQIFPQGPLSEWAELSLIFTISLMLSVAPLLAASVAGIQVGAVLLLWLACLSIPLISGSLIRRNWLALGFAFVDACAAITIGIMAQSFVAFCFSLSAMLLICTCAGFLKGTSA